MAKKEKQLE
jgi:hypothetical protein